jgi:hypothetical protein
VQRLKKVPALLAAYFPQTAFCLNRLVTQGIGDFAALERDLLAALKHDGARWLEPLLNDPALSGKHQQCLVDEENYGPRPKAVLLTLGWITLRRPYLYSAPRGEGRFPLDSALGLVDIRRGMAKAKVVVFLGDGAIGVWKLARLNFPNAVCILDYYHAFGPPERHPLRGGLRFGQATLSPMAQSAAEG